MRTIDSSAIPGRRHIIYKRILKIVILLPALVGCGGAAFFPDVGGFNLPTEPLNLPPCMVDTAEMTFENNSKTDQSYKVFLDGERVITLEPCDRFIFPCGE